MKLYVSYRRSKTAVLVLILFQMSTYSNSNFDINKYPSIVFVFI